MAVVSMSKQEFSRLEVLLRVQSGRLRVSDACALNVSAAAGVSFLLCTPGDISILRRHNQNGLEIQLQPPLLASPPKEPASWGWGGPPKGAGRGGPRRSFAKGHTQGFVCGKPKTFVYHSRLGDPVKMAEAKKLAAAKAEREEQLIQRLGDIALNSENEMAAIRRKHAPRSGARPPDSFTMQDLTSSPMMASGSCPNSVINRSTSFRSVSIRRRPQRGHLVSEDRLSRSGSRQF
jgi:hypothetical protein